ncbi:HINT domain-containing protein [Mumia sp. zg.B53]|uniref:polymorphic toxin-type HINT domain-containing protein n=1 Tax=Mumia sp. zg.B53 TaxID=2855449 RepID=UPI001C6DE993|nr:polymorphic toxin-type HINT domain-containing protein [Mumia sp. zg.B53]MBW9214981.1 HINT domain-containing protein [Mumia sp. zg.B53]
MKRLLAPLVALAVGWLVAPSVASASTTEPGQVPGYTYDGGYHGVASLRLVNERGPPGQNDAGTAYDAVYRWSGGASARIVETLVAAPTTAYTTGAGYAQVAKATEPTQELAQGIRGHLSSLHRTQVAANTGRTAARACSFAGATTVLMADGTHKPIEDVKVGDKVIATDPETGEQTAKSVEQVFVHDDTVIDLIVDSEVITTTEDHPFWSVTDQRFERADELSAGEKAIAAGGREVSVSGLRVGTAREALAYNLSVEGIHNYHVGDDKILVHNTCNVRGLWQITKEGTAATKQGPFGTVSKSKSDALWWSRDTAGHGGSTWKVYTESSRRLIWRADANQYGDFIIGKHKSDVGTFIPWKDLN